MTVRHPTTEYVYKWTMPEEAVEGIENFLGGAQ